jgi:hypothetical protein
MLSEINQTQKAKYCISFLYRMQTLRNDMNIKGDCLVGMNQWEQEKDDRKVNVIEVLLSGCMNIE